MLGRVDAGLSARPAEHPVLPAAVRGAERADRPAAEQGHPTVVLWNGSLDGTRLLTAEAVMAVARKWFAAQRIVVGHANHATVTTVYGDLLVLVAARGLRTVTPADVWATPAQLLRGVTATGRVALD